MPGGIFTVSRRCSVTWPLPWHVTQGFAMICPAPRHCGQGNGEETLLVTDLPAAPALRAGCRRGPRRRAAAVTGCAFLLPRDLDRRLGALGRFFERDLQVVPQVGAALRAAAPSAAAENVAEAKQVAEVAEDVFEAGERRRVESARADARADARVTEPIVGGALVGIRQHRVRLGRLLELLLGSLVAGIAVRVVLQGQLPVRALDLGIARRALDAQHLVVVALVHALATFTIDGRSSRSRSL
jgi:hypothetical protein